MPRPALARTNPLEGIDRLLIDGSNLLHALRRGEAPAPPATLIGRLRGVIEMPVRIELLFDGPPDPGLRDARIASGLVVRYSGRMTADALLARMVGEAVDLSVRVSFPVPDHPPHVPFGGNHLGHAGIIPARAP